MTSPWQVCLDLSNRACEGGAILLWRSIPKKPKVKATHMEGPNWPKLEDSWESCRSKGGRMGKRHKGGTRMVMSVAAGGPRQENCLKKLGQAQFSVEKPDLRDIITDTASRLKVVSEISDMASNGGDGGIYER